MCTIVPPNLPADAGAYGVCVLQWRLDVGTSIGSTWKEAAQFCPAGWPRTCRAALRLRRAVCWFDRLWDVGPWKVYGWCVWTGCVDTGHCQWGQGVVVAGGKQGVQGLKRECRQGKGFFGVPRTAAVYKLLVLCKERVGSRSQ
jgi:hypothetical protein